MRETVLLKKANKSNLSKKELLRLQPLLSLIESGRNNKRASLEQVVTSEVFTGTIKTQVVYINKPNSSTIPTTTLTAKGFVYGDVQKLEEVLKLFDLGKIIIENDYIFDGSIRRPRTNFLEDTPQEIVIEEQNNILIRLIDFNLEAIEGEAQNIINILPNNNDITVLYFEGNSLKRDLQDETFECPFIEEADPLDLLVTLIRSDKPQKSSDLGGKNKNWGRTVSETNERVAKILHLRKIGDLIINKNGYKIDKEKFHILVLPKNTV